MLTLNTKIISGLTAQAKYDASKFKKLITELDKHFRKLNKTAFVSEGLVHTISSGHGFKELGHTALIQAQDDTKFIDDDNFLIKEIAPIAKRLGFSIDSIVQGSGSLGMPAVEIGFTPYEVR